MTSSKKTQWLRWALVMACTAGGAVAAAALLGAFRTSATAADLPPVAQQLSAFAQAPLEPTAVPESVRKFEEDVGARAGYGEARGDQVRLLARGLGLHRVDVYGFPTTGGAVCFVVDEATYVASCAPRFHTSDGNVVWGIYSGLGTPQTVMGLASDRVARVDVVANGTVTSATLRDNVFFWQAADGVSRADITALRVRQADGSTISVAL